MRPLEESLKSEQCRRILEQLELGPMTVPELVKLTKLTHGSVAKHVNVLELAHLVKLADDGTVTKR